MKNLITLIALLAVIKLNAQNIKVPDINGFIPEYFPGGNNFFPPGDQAENIFSNALNFPFEIGSFNEKYPKGGVIYGNMDIDSDLEIIYHLNNKVFCINTDGSPVAGWPISVDSNQTIEWVPSYGDITGNGTEEIVFATTNGQIYAYNKIGNLLSGFPLNAGQNPFIATLGDLNGDYDYEIVLGISSGPTNGGLVAYEGDGSLVPGFPVNLNEKIAGHASVGDINNNGKSEIFIQTKTKLWGFNGNGSQISGFPFALSGINEVFSYSSPILVDLDNDLNHEILFASHETTNGKLYVLNNDGTIVTGWPQTTQNWIYAAPTPTDIDNDGVFEIIIGDFDQSEEPNSSVYSFKMDGTLIRTVSSLYGITSITALDINNNGYKELLIDANNQEGVEGKYFALDKDLNVIEGWPLTSIGNSVFAPLILGDLNNTGTISIMSLNSEFISNHSFLKLWTSNMTYTANSTINPFYQINRFHNGYLEREQHSTNINSNFNNKTIKVFPNPASNVLNIVSEAEITHIELTDLNGKKLIIQSSKTKRVKLDISNLSQGVYLLLTNTKEGNSYKRIVKN